MKLTLSDKTESRIKQFVLHKDNLVLQSSSKVRSTRLHIQRNRRYMMSGCDWSIVLILQRSRLNHSLQSVHIVINLHRFVGKKRSLNSYEWRELCVFSPLLRPPSFVALYNQLIHIFTSFLFFAFTCQASVMSLILTQQKKTFLSTNWVFAVRVMILSSTGIWEDFF